MEIHECAEDWLYSGKELNPETLAFAYFLGNRSMEDDIKMAEEDEQAEGLEGFALAVKHVIESQVIPITREKPWDSVLYWKSGTSHTPATEMPPAPDMGDCIELWEILAALCGDMLRLSRSPIPIAASHPLPLV